MTRWGMVIDLDKCVGCQSCMAACKQENNVPISTPQEEQKDEDISWIEMLSYEEHTYGTPASGQSWTLDYRYGSTHHEIELNNDIELIPRPCFHCWDATCVKVCPVRATYIDEEGLVAQIYPRCIGCRMCTVGCPYSVRQFNWKRPKWPQEMSNMLNPDVAIRPKHVVERGTFCYQRRQIAGTDARVKKEGLDPENDYVPACAEACPSNAIYFGDIDDPSTKVHELKESRRAFRIGEHLGQKPKVWYLQEQDHETRIDKHAKKLEHAVNTSTTGEEA